MDNTIGPYTLETDSSDESDSSDSSEEGNLLSNNLGVLNNKFETKNVRFMNQEKVEEYQYKRNKLFTPETYIKIITINVTSSGQSFNLEDQLNSNNHNIIGFKILKSNLSNPDPSKYYADLIIDEIPEITCDKNDYGKSIITRISLSKSSDYNTQNYLELSSIHRYFYPQKINSLTVSFLDSTDSILNVKGNLIFEITHLNEKVHHG